MGSVHDVFEVCVHEYNMGPTAEHCRHEYNMGPTAEHCRHEYLNNEERGEGVSVVLV